MIRKQPSKNRLISPMLMNTSPTAAAAMIWFVRIVISEYKNIVVLTMSPVKNTVQINIEIRR